MRARAKQTPVVVKDTPVDPATLEQFCTCKEAAQILKMSEISIRRFLTQKRLTRLKCGARTLLRLSEVLSMVREAPSRERTPSSEGSDVATATAAKYGAK
jgi:hypothetical protein